MKKEIFFTSIVTIALFFVGSCCKKKKDPCTYNSQFVDIVVPYSDHGATVLPWFINLLPTGQYMPAIFSSKAESTVESQVQSNGLYQTCQTSSIGISALRVTIDSPANQNFNFIDSITLSIMTKNGTDTLLVASKGGIPAGAQDIIMDILPDRDIKKYVIADSFAFVIGARKSSMPVANTTDSTYLRFDAGFKAKVFTK